MWQKIATIDEQLKQKIDELIQENKKAQRERKKDRILSKIDGLYYVLVTLSTFISGIIVAQHEFVFSFGAEPWLVGSVISMLVSFVVGFRAMVNDSLENRMLSWCLLFLSLMIYAWSGVSYLSLRLLGETNRFWFLIASGAGSLVLGMFTPKLAKRLTGWMEAKLSFLLGEKLDVWSKINKDLMYDTLLVVSISILANSLLSLVK